MPISRPHTLLAAARFCFLNEEGEIRAREDWNSAGRDKLWLYNLHYFDDLNAAHASNRDVWHRALISRWIRDNPPGLGNGWEPYPLSLRIVNWIKWALAGNPLDQAWRLSLAAQARYLNRRVEWHLLGNHLLANAKALVFAGTYFEGAEARQWRNKGLNILERQLPEQILADGGHFELSPMYHAIILEDLLDLLNLGSAYPGILRETFTTDWRERVQKMRSWLTAMLHPDRGISFFNDAAFGIAPDMPALNAFAERLRLPEPARPAAPITHLTDSGYLRVECGPVVAFLDVGPVGPDYLPAHAHADTLSFELSLFGQRTVVNSGISCYGIGPERQRQRSTAAHSTVEIDGQDSSEVWGGFRVARRARPFDLSIGEKDNNIEVRCAHDGYRRLSGAPVHRRCWRISKRSAIVTDTVEGLFDRAVARFHIHPAVRVEDANKSGHLVFPDGRRIVWRSSSGSARVTTSSWHPEFGLSLPNRCIEVNLPRGKAEIEFLW